MKLMQRMEDAFSQSGFMPHGHCYLWKPLLVSIHVLSDFFIGLAYVGISATLYILVRRINIGFNRIVLFFGVFIGACGLTHFMEIWNLWHADYWWSAWIKVITAIASVGTGIYLWKLRHPIVTMAEAVKLAEDRRIDLEALNLSLEQKVAERTQQFEDSERKFKMIANSIPQLAWMTDASGYITWYNERWFEYTGTTLEEMQGWGWQKVHHPEHAERVSEKWIRHLKSGEDWEDTFPLRGKDGGYRWFLSRAYPIRNDRGEITHWFGTNTDIEENRNQRLQLKELSQDLEQAVKSRDEFLSVASHELKTPLTTLLLQSQLQKRHLVRDPLHLDRDRIGDFIDLMEKLAVRLNRTVEDMLDISRISSGKLSIHREPFDLCEAVKDVIERLWPAFAQEGYERPRFEGQSVTGNWDKLRIEQVVDNLLTNAMKYGEGKSITVRIDADDRTAAIKVIDRGMGISKEDQRRIFERFERAVNPNEVSGLGLGLYISRQIIEAHGGELSVESEPGMGSTFIVRLYL